MSTFSVLLSLYDERRLYVVEAQNAINAVAYAKRIAAAHDDAGSNWQLEVAFHGASNLAMAGSGLKAIDLRATAHETVPHAQRGGGC
ncbi:hypothetical protein D869_gp177 [Caulobacter phage CcrRogue]|uniref:Uncharacterized protein n=1 Tax=Caulobacter phage CcrRogue TaxID=2927986 RepID=K4K3C4_9CAUD|nr:hypothetical protein D869_gp177 [Caulobacter phage CcrRogue]AFU86737.1 hypothetical protein CcrRogue_gp255 [Caulobacter phage CcrRogue]